jgi:hypothetical protein
MDRLPRFEEFAALDTLLDNPKKSASPFSGKCSCINVAKQIRKKPHQLTTEGKSA